jgi:hypothetical protein
LSDGGLVKADLVVKLIGYDRPRLLPAVAIERQRIQVQRAGWVAAVFNRYDLGGDVGDGVAGKLVLDYQLVLGRQRWLRPACRR